MNFSELFSSGFKKRNQDHFASIIRIAMGDGIITDEEKEFMDRLAQKLENFQRGLCGNNKKLQRSPH